jgi:hypothetical protein
MIRCPSLEARAPGARWSPPVATSYRRNGAANDAAPLRMTRIRIVEGTTGKQRRSHSLRRQPRFLQALRGSLCSKVTALDVCIRDGIPR